MVQRVSGPETKCDRAVTSNCLLVRMRVVYMRVCLNVIRAYEEWRARNQNAKEIPERCTFGLAFLFRLVPDVWHCGSGLIQHNIHEYTSARHLGWLFVVAVVVVVRVLVLACYILPN